MNKHPITKTVSVLIKDLTPRNRDILSRRYGLKSGKKETLESIGKSYGITRERVRQIEESTLNQLTKATRNDTELAKYINLVSDIIKRSGGVISESGLFNEFSGNDKDNTINASLVFVLRLNKELVRVSESDDNYVFWALNKDYADSFKVTSASLIKAVEKQKAVLAEKEFYDFVQKSDIPGIASQPLTEKHVELCLSINKNLDRNIFNEIGLATWPEIKPSGVKDKAHLVLKKEKSPKHFAEITKLINIAGFNGKKANVQTVHNELIKDNRFVLIGRGIYALSEWGYKPGTVKEVLVDILKRSSKPLLKSAILSRVMDARLVKENTVLLNLQDSKIFTKNKDGTYSLRQV